MVALLVTAFSSFCVFERVLIYFCVLHSFEGQEQLADQLTHHIRRFVTTPLAVFEAEMAGTGMDVPELMAETARCLAVCLKVIINVRNPLASIAE